MYTYTKNTETFKILLYLFLTFYVNLSHVKLHKLHFLL